MSGLLVAGCELRGDRNVDLRLREGRIAEIGKGLARDGEEVIEALGGAVIPGLHDHHVHTLSLAASLRSVVCGPPAVVSRADLAGALRDAARAAPPGSWLRGVGYHESVAGPLDRWQLDALIGDRPLRIQHRSGALWMLNSAGVRAAGLDLSGPPGVELDASGQSTGRLFRSDRWLSERVPREPLDLAAVGRLLAAAGVTGITDATPDLTPTAVNAIQGALVSGALPQHLMALGAPDDANSGLVPGPYK
ncbi:MAG TPA: amidohydrolase family protein, partial [Acidimicrobiales bacterium]|nr:amidohydrolase family protein [Acidimicrobiales bacterium]